MKRLVSMLVFAALGLPTAVHARGPSESAPESEPEVGSESQSDSESQALATEPPSAPTVARFALVIGSNATADDSQTPLRFADDDAARMTEVLVEAGVDVELATSLDRDSQALFAELVPRAHPPDRDGVDAAWAALLERMDAARHGGAPSVELLIYYSGHGDVGPDGQGYLTLQGGKLKRRDLFRRLLAKSTADQNHLLIDACKSEQFVLTRGKGGGPWRSDRSAHDYSDAVGEYLDRNHLGHFPNTGVVLAHSADQQTHEWERYRGGIFTHELVSGLRGGADLNGDGAIEYSELGAFVSAANHGVADPRARLSVVVRPPVSNERHPLIAHSDVAKRRVLYFSAGDRNRYTVEDARGVRIADVRRSGEHPGYLRLPAGDMFVMRTTPAQADSAVEAALPADAGGLVLATQLAFSPAQSAARGSLDQAFRAGLFTTPYGPGYYHGFTGRTGLLTLAEPEWHVEVWKEEVDGSRTKVAEVVTDTEPEIQVGDDEDTDDDEDEDDADADDPKTEIKRRHPKIAWGAIGLGTVITPFRADEAIPLSPKRVRSDQFRGCLSPHDAASCSAVRGFDLRWQLFSVAADARFPRLVGWFRSGYQAGHASFAAGDADVGFVEGNPTALSYVVVPLHVGGHVFLFEDFPVRPYAGLGIGFDVVRLQYTRHQSPRLKTNGALFGFGVHAGLELRLTNYVTLSAEVRQQWTTRKRIDKIPDFSNSGLTFTMGVAAGFPLTPMGVRAQRERRRANRK